MGRWTASLRSYEAARATSLLLSMGTPLHEDKITPQTWRSWYRMIRAEMAKAWRDQHETPNPAYDAWLALP